MLTSNTKIIRLNFYAMIRFNLRKMGILGKWVSFNNSNIDESSGHLFKYSFSYTYGIGAKFQLCCGKAKCEAFNFKAHGEVTKTPTAANTRRLTKRDITIPSALS